jgi:hypothetical protein
MTLEEKVGQMTQAERGAVTNDASLVTTWRLGSVLSGGGSVPTPNTPQAWEPVRIRDRRVPGKQSRGPGSGAGQREALRG